MEKEKLIKEITKKVIEAIHGLPYEEAIKKESQTVGCKMVCNECGKDVSMNMDGKYYCCNVTMPNISRKDVYYPLPITIGRVMQALVENYGYRNGNIFYGCPNAGEDKYEEMNLIIWKQNDLGTATLEDQSEETIQALIKLLKKY